MESKEYMVIGLGNFGCSVAKQLEINGCKVLAVDREPEKVKSIGDIVTYAVCADVTDFDSLKELGVRNFDGAIISLGRNFEAMVLSILWLKEHGVMHIIAKTRSELQSKILKKVGADEVIFPESEMGVHVANNIAMGTFFDTIELSDEYSIVDITVPDDWVGKNLKELRCREKYGINVIGLKRHNRLTITPSADEPVMKDDVFVVIGKNDMLKKIGRKI